MRHLIFYTNTNSWSDRLMRRLNDGDEFTREARKYAIHHGDSGDVVYKLGVSGKLSNRERFRKVFSTMAGVPECDVLAFFCHGWRTGMQHGFRWRWGARMLAQCMINMKAKYLVLYACSCGKTEDNFAKWIAEELFEANYKPFKVIAHATRGHTTRNPNVVLYRNVPGRIVYKQRLPDWGEWKEMLKGEYRFDFPFVPIEELEV